MGEAPDVDGAAPWWIECKHLQQEALAAALDQARDGMHAADRPQDEYPVAFCKQDRKRPKAVLMLADLVDFVNAHADRLDERSHDVMVVLDLEEFVEILRQAHGPEEEPEE